MPHLSQFGPFFFLVPLRASQVLISWEELTGASPGDPAHSKAELECELLVKEREIGGHVAKVRAEREAEEKERRRGQSESRMEAVRQSRAAKSTQVKRVKRAWVVLVDPGPFLFHFSLVQIPVRPPPKA